MSDKTRLDMDPKGDIFIHGMGVPVKFSRKTGCLYQMIVGRWLQCKQITANGVTVYAANGVLSLLSPGGAGGGYSDPTEIATGGNGVPIGDAISRDED